MHKGKLESSVTFCSYHHEEVKKVVIQSRPNHSSSTSKRNLGVTTTEVEKHYSHSSATSSEFGSVMHYVSSPESAYSTGYSTLHSDDCVSPATAVAKGCAPQRPEIHVEGSGRDHGAAAFNAPPLFELSNNCSAPRETAVAIAYVDCEWWIIRTLCRV